MNAWRKQLIGAAALVLGVGAAFFCGAEAATKGSAFGDDPTVELVAQSAQRWTGVAVTPMARIFVSYPAGVNRAPFQVAEMVGGVPLPILMDAPLVSAESVVADETGALWVLDSGKLPGEAADPTAAKLCRIDVASGEITRTYPFSSEVVLPDTALSDVRVDPARGFAYLTDSGHGGIIALDLATGEAWRALTDIPEVQANVKSIYFPHTGLFTQLAHSDGLELSKDRAELFFSAMGGDCLYAVKTAALRDRAKSVGERQKDIRWLNINNLPTDGMVLREGTLYMGDLADEGVWAFELGMDNANEAGRILQLKKDVRWADSFALAPDGSIYFTTSATNYPPEQQPPYELCRLVFPQRQAAR
ncbi:MAG: L-dopachrome tautomerase-related protein [Schwartzia sp. (in: firmicutes)]